MVLRSGFFHPITRLLLLLGHCGLLFYLSSLSDVGPSHLPPGSDKVVHFCLYATLGFLAFHFLCGRPHAGKHWLWLVAWGFCIAYGISDEFHQTFVPHRTASLWDLVFDAMGSIAGILAYPRVIGRFLDTPRVRL